MKEVELKADKTAPTAAGAGRRGHPNGSAPRAPINQQAASAYTLLLKSKQDELPEPLARTLNSLTAALNQPLSESPAGPDAPARTGPFTKLSLQVMSRDEALKERIAQSLSSSRHFVRQREAAAEFEAKTAALPPALQETAEPGRQLAKFICEGLVSLTDPDSMGAGLERDLAVRGVFVPEQKLNLRAKAAAGEALSASMAFIKSNQPEVLAQLSASAQQTPHPAASPLSPADEASLTAMLTPASDRDAAAALGQKAPEAPDTYNDIFKHNKTENSDEVSAQMSERIRSLISKAAATAAKGHLMSADAGAAPTQSVPDSSPQASEITYNSQKEPAAETGAPKDAAKLSLAELSARASKLQQQFREERRRMAAEGKLPNPAPLPQMSTNSSSPAAESKTAAAPAPELQIPRDQRGAQTGITNGEKTLITNTAADEQAVENEAAPTAVKDPKTAAQLSAAKQAAEAELAQLKAQLQSQAEFAAQLAKSKDQLLKTQQEIMQLQQDVARMQEQTLQAAKETAAAQLKQQQLQLQAQQALNARTQELLQQEQAQAQPPAQEEQKPADQQFTFKPYNKTGSIFVENQKAANQRAEAAANNTAAPDQQPETEPAAEGSPVLQSRPQSRTASAQSALSSSGTDAQSDKLMKLYAQKLQSEPEEPEQSTRKTSSSAVEPEDSAENAELARSVQLKENALKSTYDAIEVMLSSISDEPDQPAKEPETVPAENKHLSKGASLYQEAAAAIEADSVPAEEAEPAVKPQPAAVTVTAPTDDAPETAESKPADTAAERVIVQAAQGSEPSEADAEIPETEETAPRAETVKPAVDAADDSKNSDESAQTVKPQTAVEAEAEAPADEAAVMQNTAQAGAISNADDVPADDAPASQPNNTHTNTHAERTIVQASQGSEPSDAETEAADDVAPLTENTKQPAATAEAEPVISEDEASVDEAELIPSAGQTAGTVNTDEIPDTDAPAAQSNKQTHTAAERVIEQAAQGSKPSAAENEAAETEAADDAAQRTENNRPAAAADQAADAADAEAADDVAAALKPQSRIAASGDEDAAEKAEPDVKQPAASTADKTADTDAAADEAAKTQNSSAAAQTAFTDISTDLEHSGTPVKTDSASLQFDSTLSQNTPSPAQTQQSTAAAFKQLYQGSLQSMAGAPGQQIPTANTLEAAVDADADADDAVKAAAAATGTAGTAGPAAAEAENPAPNTEAAETNQDVKAGIMQTVLSTVPGDDFKDDEDLPVQQQTAVQTAPRHPPLTAPAAAAVLSGANQPVPEMTQVRTRQHKEGGLFKRIASLFTGRSSAAPASAAPALEDQPVQLNARSGDPLQKFFADLRLIAADPSLPAAVKQEADDFMRRLNQPVADLTTVNNWLNFITGPLSPNSPQALALHQWAFLLLCIRFSQLGKDISKFTANCRKENPEMAARIESAAASTPKESRAVTAMIDDTFSQVQRLQQLTDPQGGLMAFLSSYVPLPPSYDGGSEGGFNLKKETDEDGKDSWHLNFFFDVKDLGPIQIKAEARLPELFLHIVTDNLEALQTVQDLLPTLTKKLQEIGVTTREGTVRLGHVFMPTASFKEPLRTRRDEMSSLSVDI